MSATPKLVWPDRRAYPFAHRELPTSKGRLAFVEEGVGPIVVFLHGHLGWSYTFRRTIAELAKTHRVIALDLLGFGRSQKPETALTPAEHARIVCDFLSGKGIENATLVAHEAGVAIGMAALADRPTLFSRLLLANGTFRSADPGSPEEKAAKAAAGLLGGLAYERANPAALAGPLFREKALFDKPTHDAYHGPFELKTHRAGPRRLAAAPVTDGKWLDHLWGKRVELLDRPTLLFWGMKDPLHGERCLDGLWHAVPAAEVERHPEAGAFAVEERADALAAAVARLASGAVDHSQAIRLV